MKQPPNLIARIRLLLPAFLCLGLASQSAFGQWVKVRPTIGNPIYAMTASSKNLFVGTFYGILRSSDNGEHWDSASSGLTTLEVRTMATAGDKILAGTQGGGVFESTDEGDTWVNSDSGLPPNLSIYAMAANGQNVFAGGIGLFASTDHAVSWYSVGDGVGGKFVLSMASRGVNTYAGTYDAGIYKSDSNGKSWASANTGMPDTVEISALLLTPPGPMYAGGPRVYVSKDSARHWQESVHGLPSDAPGANCFAYHGNLVFLGGVGVYMTSDQGESWTNVSEGLGPVQVFALAADDKYLYAAYPGNGIFRRPLAELTVGVRDRENRGADFGFDPDSRTILIPGAGLGFTTRTKGWVDLGLYDTKGNKAVTLVHSELPAGKHRAAFAAPAMPAGIYFLRLHAAGGISTRRILLGG